MSYMMIFIVLVTGLVGTVVIGSFLLLVTSNLIDMWVENQEAKERDKR